MSGPTAWMPFYIADYLGDTQRLTTEQHGAYLLLMLDYWRSGPPPDDDAVLQQITKLERSAWKKHKPALARMFIVTDGAWHHKRIDRELANAATNAERRSIKAKAAAEARWGDAPSMPEVCSEDAPSMPEAMLAQCPSPSSSKKYPTGKPVGASQRANRLPKDFSVPPDWRAWAVQELGIPRQATDTEAAKFVDYWHAKSGRDATKLDWQATWRNWCRNARQARPARTVPHGEEEDFRDRILP